MAPFITRNLADLYNNFNSAYQFVSSYTPIDKIIKCLAPLNFFNPSRISSNASLENTIQDRYIISLKTVRTIEDAQVICLAETHHREDIRAQNAKIIDALYRPGDLVLVEELSHLPLSQPFRTTKHVTVPIEIKGWDCELEPSIPGIPFFMLAIDSNVERNNHMHKIIDESLHHARIFVIAGRLHFYDNDPLLKQGPPSLLEAVTSTVKFLKQKRAVILVPKEGLNKPILSDKQKATPPPSKIIQTENSKKVRPYPTDLSDLESYQNSCKTSTLS